MDKLNFYTIKDDYISYLRKFDNKVIDNKTSDNRKFDRKYIGVVFKINNFKYFAPLASFKAKHFCMKDTLDFIKIDTMAVINLNNMIPVSDDQITYCDIEKEKDIKYRDLLRNEYKICKKKENLILKNAHKLYEKVTIYSSFISQRCVNFKLLEEKSLEYKSYLELTREVAAAKEIKNKDIEKENENQEHWEIEK